MLFMKFRTVAAALLAAGLVVIGAGVFARQHQEGKAAPPAKAESPPEAKPNDPKEAESPSAGEIRDILREAAREASNAGDSNGKSNVLREIALAQAKSGNVDDARSSYQLAVQSAKNLKLDPARFPGDTTDQLLKLIAKSQVKSGFIKEAAETAKSIRTEETRLPIADSIATSLARTGDIDHALQLAESFSDEQLKITLITTIAVTQAKKAGPQAARPWIKNLGSPLIKSRALLGIAAGVAEREFEMSGFGGGLGPAGMPNGMGKSKGEK